MDLSSTGAELLHDIYIAGGVWYAAKRLALTADDPAAQSAELADIAALEEAGMLTGDRNGVFRSDEFIADRLITTAGIQTTRGR